MLKFQRILFLVALLFLVFFTFHHIYQRFIRPTHSVLDKFDQPMKDKIVNAKSLAELVAMYEIQEKLVKTALEDRKKEKVSEAESDKPSRFDLDYDRDDQEPFRTRNQIRQAIKEWELTKKLSSEIYFYWLVGLFLVTLGCFIYFKRSHWLGLGLYICGFCEMIYWSSPTFFGSGISQSWRLLIQKIIFSGMALVILVVVAELIGVLKNNPEMNSKIKL